MFKLLHLSGEPSLDKDGIKIDMKNNNTYGMLDISNRTNNNLTIYMVVKANEINSDNARIFEIPKNPGGDQWLTTPCMYVNQNTNYINYGSFGNNVDTQVNALEFNSIAITINEDLGKMNAYINGNKYDLIDFNDIGDILYLSHCTCNSSGYGNNTYKMIGVEYSVKPDEQIYYNLDWLNRNF